jgi:acetoin utilization protein AcuB
MEMDCVRDWMTHDPVTVSPDTALTEAGHMMQTHDIRRMPVVKHGQLVGIITWGDIRRASASDAPSLAGFEADYLIAKITVKRVMSTGLITVTPETPVMDGDTLVGILTGSDVFKMLTTDTDQAA